MKTERTTRISHDALPPRETSYELNESNFAIVGEWEGLVLVRVRVRQNGRAEWKSKDTFHSISVMTAGSVARSNFEVDGQEFTNIRSRRGSVEVYPAGLRWMAESWDAFADALILYLPPDFAAALAPERRLGTPPLKPSFSTTDMFLLENALALDSACRATDDLAELQADLLWRSITLHLLRRHQHAPLPAPLQRIHFSRVMATRLNEYIQDNLGAPIRLTDLAAVADINARRFQTKFLDTFGVTPAQYIISLRLRRAHELIRQTRKPLSLIAHATGFSSHSHMTAAFKERFGVTPSSVRRERLPGGHSDE